MTPQVGFPKLQRLQNLDAHSCQKDHKNLTVKMWPTRACSAHGPPLTLLANEPFLVSHIWRLEFQQRISILYIYLSDCFFSNFRCGVIG
jgi:hypothetical protein